MKIDKDFTPQQLLALHSWLQNNTPTGLAVLGVGFDPQQSALMSLRQGIESTLAQALEPDEKKMEGEIPNSHFYDDVFRVADALQEAFPPNDEDEFIDYTNKNEGVRCNFYYEGEPIFTLIEPSIIPSIREKIVIAGYQYYIYSMSWTYFDELITIDFTLNNKFTHTGPE